MKTTINAILKCIIVLKRSLKFKNINNVKNKGGLLELNHIKLENYYYFCLKE